MTPKGVWIADGWIASTHLVVPEQTRLDEPRPLCSLLVEVTLIFVTTEFIKNLPSRVRSGCTHAHMRHMYL